MKFNGEKIGLGILIICCLALLWIFVSCKKKEQHSQPIQQPQICKNWEGEWWSVGGDSLFKDSLVIKFDKQENNITFYMSNIEYLNSTLHHECPYKQIDDNLTLVKGNKKFIFRYNH